MLEFIKQFRFFFYVIPFLWQPAESGSVRIYRDGWGVPHIHGDTTKEVMFGFGYAQAEDRLEAILRNYLGAAGEMSSVFGREHIDSDFKQKLWRHAAISREKYLDIPSDVRSLIESYLAGLIGYMREYPSKIPSWAFEPKAYHVISLGRHIEWKVLEQQADREFLRLPPAARLGNQWVIEPERSSDNAVVLLIDPHTTWLEDSRWYEAHLHGGSLHAFGYTQPGMPVLLTGHNNRLGWAIAEGGADAADVYEIELDSADATTFRDEHLIRPIHTDTVLIAVQSGDRIQTQVRHLQRTHLGPILSREGRRAYAYNMSLKSEIGQIEQYYRQMIAGDLEQFYDALGLAQVAPKRVMYGDVEGNLFYIQTGRIPIRSELYRWDSPVSANTDLTAWQGAHSQDDLIQIHNPTRGWIQDCGAYPIHMTASNSLTSDRFPRYIYRMTLGAESPRSARASSLLDSHSRITHQEAMDLAADTYVIQSEHWLRAINVVYNAVSDQNPELASSLEVLNQWDGRADTDALGMTLYARWQHLCRQEKGTLSIQNILTHQPLGEKSQLKLLAALAQATLELQTRYGTVSVPWGRVHRFAREDRSWGVSGSSGNGLETLRAIRAPLDGALYNGKSGQSCTTLVFFNTTGKVESYSAVPFGQTDHQDSKHFVDQAESLFSQARLKSTGYQTTPSVGLKLHKTLMVP